MRTTNKSIWSHAEIESLVLISNGLDINQRCLINNFPNNYAQTFTKVFQTQSIKDWDIKSSVLARWIILIAWFEINFLNKQSCKRQVTSW